jgi:hypothetical protein
MKANQFLDAVNAFWEILSDADLVLTRDCLPLSLEIS